MLDSNSKSRRCRRIRVAAEAALLLALAVLAELLTRSVPKLALGPFRLDQLLVATLIDLVLIIGAGTAGLAPAAAAAVLSPVAGYFTGAIPAVPVLIVAVALGNLLLTAVMGGTFRLSRGLYRYPAAIVNMLGVLAGAGADCALLRAATERVILPLSHASAPTVQAIHSGFTLAPGVAAFAAGLLSILILPAVWLNDRTLF